MHASCTSIIHICTSGLHRYVPCWIVWTLGRSGQVILPYLHSLPHCPYNQWAIHPMLSVNPSSPLRHTRQPKISMASRPRDCPRAAVIRAIGRPAVGLKFNKPIISRGSVDGSPPSSCQMDIGRRASTSSINARTENSITPFRSPA